MGLLPVSIPVQIREAAMNLNKITEANQRAREATAVIQANVSRMDKLPLVTLERILEMVSSCRSGWEDVEKEIRSVIDSQK